jgi:hypothetical protein
MRIAWALPALTLTMALLTSCGSSMSAPAPSTSAPGIIYGEAPPVEEYLSNLRELESLAAPGSIFFGELDPPSQEEYRAIVRRYREQGLDALPREERESLLLVAQFAFLAYGDTLRYSLVAQGTEGNPQDRQHGQAVMEEVYLHDPGLLPAAVRTTGTAIGWPWPLWPRWDPDAPTEVRAFLEYPSPDAKEKFPAETVWINDTGEWTCLRWEFDSFTWAFTYGPYFSKFGRFAHGDLIGEDTLDGRPAYKFEGPNVGEKQITYWLDADTLWLRQYEYEEDGIHYLVKLEAVNEEITIEPPDVDVECVEEEAE